MCRRCWGGAGEGDDEADRKGFLSLLHPSGQEVRFGQRLKAGPEDDQNRSSTLVCSVFHYQQIAV